jgi:hypothetical protein
LWQEAIMSEQPDHELETLEYDQTVPPRPEEVIADLTRPDPAAEPATGSAAAEETPPVV